MNNCYEAVCRGENVRENLIELKKLCKDSENVQELKHEIEPAVLERLLADPDAKVRKNAALLIGMLGFSDSVPALLAAYESEETRFVKSAYLTACTGMDVTEYLPKLTARYEELLHQQAAPEEQKHLMEERKQLLQLLSENGSVQKHTFTGWRRRNDVIFTTERPLREELRRQLRSHAAADTLTAVHPFGVRVKTGELSQLSRLHTYQELLFMLNVHGVINGDAEALAEQLLASDLIPLLEALHKEPAPFYFRVELRGMRDAAEKSRLAHALAERLECGSDGKLQNSTTAYEAELRLTRTRDGGFFPCLKLYTLPDERFAWRRQVTSASMQPYLAASMIELARPYLFDDAVVLDALCGAGTFVIERNLRGKTYDNYAVDIFGEAVAAGKENAAAAGVECNFITKDFLEFTSKHQMTEIYADMPRRIGKMREELDGFYGGCFDKFSELLENGGRLFLYATEEGTVKKYLRLHRELGLVREYPVRPSEEGVFYIIKKR